VQLNQTHKYYLLKTSVPGTGWTARHIRGMSGKYPVILSISRTGRVALLCNFAASQRRPSCASVDSHSPMGLVSRQWDVVDWACVLCYRRIHKSPPLQRRFLLWEKPKVTGRQIWAVEKMTRGLCDALLTCRMGRRIVVMQMICSLVHRECDGHSTQAQSTAPHCRLTSPMGEWLFTDAQ